MATNRHHKRVNDILLGPLERPALQWLAAHSPNWVTPDMMTGIGIVGSLTIFIGYILSRVHPGFLWLASIGFIINWYGDSLDGTIARFRKIERPKFGFFVDHIVDSFSEVLVMFGLGLSPFVRFDIACVALTGYLLMSVLVYVRTYVDGVFQISYGRLGPTEVRVILILVNAIMFFSGIPQVIIPKIGTFTIYDIMIAFLAVVLFSIFIISSLKQTIELARQGE